MLQKSLMHGQIAKNLEKTQKTPIISYFSSLNYTKFLFCIIADYTLGCHYTPFSPCCQDRAAQKGNMCIPQQSTAAAVSPPCSVPLAAFSSASLPFSSLVSPLAASSFARSASAERRKRRNARSLGFGEARSPL